MPSMFDTTKDFLKDVLKDINHGKIQLPDFQRGWVWDDDHIRSLLASVSLSYPIGAVMMLELGNDEVRFLPRLIEGVQLTDSVEPDQLILDGQQRLTSLFLALQSGRPVPTTNAQGKEVKRWYYVDIAKALDPSADREEAIFSVPEDRVVRNFRAEPIRDLSTPEKEYEAGCFPLARVFDYAKWRTEQNRYFHFAQEHVERFDTFENRVLETFKMYLIPVIKVSKAAPKEAICQVFEKVNTGGVPLTVFELLTATYAVDQFNLRTDWDARRRRLNTYQVLKNLDSTLFLQAITLVSSFYRKQEDPQVGITCKRKDILRLHLSEYKRWSEPVTKGFEKAAQFLFIQHVFAQRDVPYSSQLAPLAAMFVVLGDRAETEPVRVKMSRWYWCGVFGELYGGATETRFARDLPDMVSWVSGGPEPLTIADAVFSASRLRRIRTRNSAAYKGLSALLLRDGAQDFRSGIPVTAQVFSDENIDIHHIFPRAYCEKQHIPANLVDSVINKTPLSARTNRLIGGKAPSSYLNGLERDANLSSDGLDALLRTHVIDPRALRADDFDAFFAAREQALLRRIEQVTGKPIAGGAVSTEGEAQEIDEPDEEDIA